MSFHGDPLTPEKIRMILDAMRDKPGDFLIRLHNATANQQILVPPSTFDELVEAGVIDKEGNFL